MRESVRPASGPTRVRLTHRGRTIALTPGGYLIGRGAECHLRIDTARVSRMHARVVVDSRSVTIEDLNSANGLFVNGQRVERAQRLDTGDVVVVGEEEFTVSVTPAASEPLERDTNPEILVTPVPLGGTPHAATTKASALELLGSVAERALAAGQPQHAESAVRQRLFEVLDLANHGNLSEPMMAERALRLALALANGLRARRWLDYNLDLLTALGKPCSDELVLGLRSARAVVGEIDRERVDRYRTAVRALPATLEKLRTLALLDELADER